MALHMVWSKGSILLCSIWILICPSSFPLQGPWLLLCRPSLWEPRAETCLGLFLAPCAVLGGASLCVPASHSSLCGFWWSEKAHLPIWILQSFLTPCVPLHFHRNFKIGGSSSTERQKNILRLWLWFNQICRSIDHLGRDLTSFQY